MAVVAGATALNLTVILYPMKGLRHRPSTDCPRPALLDSEQRESALFSTEYKYYTIFFKQPRQQQRLHGGFFVSLSDQSSRVDGFTTGHD